MEAQRLSNLVFLMSMSSLALGCPSDDGGSDDGGDATTSGTPVGSGETTATPTSTGSGGEEDSGSTSNTTSGGADSGSTTGGASGSTTSGDTGETGSTKPSAICEAYATVQEMCGVIYTYKEALENCKAGPGRRYPECEMVFDELSACIGALTCREFDDPESCTEEFDAYAACLK